MSFLRAFLIIALFPFIGCKNHEKEVHFIPYGYIGKIEIIYNEKEGLPIEYDNKGRRIYRIPSNGFLKTQFSPNPGGFSFEDREFYYVDSERKKMIEWFTGINPKFRDFNKSVENYPDLVCAFGIMLSWGNKLIDSTNYIPNGYAKLEYRVDSIKNIQNY